jgi:hypothetical protein
MMEGRITGVQWAGMVTAAVFVVLLALAWVNGVHASTSYTCLQCRAELEKHRWLGVPSSNLVENECSRWYASKHADHEHEWCWCGGEFTRFPLGGKSFSCGKQHPIWRMSPQVQLEFMQSTQAPELNDFWQTMRSAPRDEQRALVDKVFEEVIEKR